MFLKKYFFETDIINIKEIANVKNILIYLAILTSPATGLRNKSNLINNEEKHILGYMSYLVYFVI